MPGNISCIFYHPIAWRQLNISPTIPNTADWEIDMNPDMTSNGNLLDVSVNRQTSGESASLPQYDEGTESAEVATSDVSVSQKK